MYAGSFPIISAEEAASHINDGAMVALSGFANAGTAKLVPRAIAIRARQIHSNGKPYKIRLITGSSSGNDIDIHLAAAPQTLLAGFFGKLDYAIIEATDLTRDGRVYLTSSIGASPAYLRYADRVFKFFVPLENNWKSL